MSRPKKKKPQRRSERSPVEACADALGRAVLVVCGKCNREQINMRAVPPDEPPPWFTGCRACGHTTGRYL